MAGWDDTLFGNLPRPRRPGQQRSGPFTAQDIVAGAAGPPQQAQPYDDPTISGQTGQAFERGAERLGAPMSVQRYAGDIGSFLGGLTGLDMPQHLSDAYNYLRNGAYGQAAGSALAAVPVVPGAAGAKAAEEIASGAKAAPSIIAYHGSPYSFDKFDASKINTGERAQSFGRGLYFAENENVAKHYRPALMQGDEAIVPPGGRNVVQDRIANAINDDVFRTKGAQAAIDDAIANLTRSYEARDPALRKLLAPTVEEQAIQTLKGLDPSNLRQGSMYQVAINAEPNQFLDWDKPLSEQPPKVQEALNNRVSAIMASDEPKNFDWIRRYHNDELSGAQIVNGLGNGTPASASDAWKQAGVPGIRYLDQGSRTANTGTSNYVVFDPATLEILKKYGLAGLGLTAGAGALSASGQSPASSPAEAAPFPQPPGMTLGAQPTWSPG